MIKLSNILNIHNRFPIKQSFDKGFNMLMMQPVLAQKAECSIVWGLEQQMARSPLVTSWDQTLKTSLVSTCLLLPNPQKTLNIQRYFNICDHGGDAPFNLYCDVAVSASSVQAGIFQQLLDRLPWNRHSWNPCAWHLWFWVFEFNVLIIIWCNDIKKD